EPTANIPAPAHPDSWAIPHVAAAKAPEQSPPPPHPDTPDISPPAPAHWPIARPSKSPSAAASSGNLPPFPEPAAHILSTSPRASAASGSHRPDPSSAHNAAAHSSATPPPPASAW